MSKSISVANILIDVLANAGVKHCYGIVGDTLNHVTEAIYHSDIEWVHVRHEEVGAFAAGAEAYICDRLTVCAGSCGPGSLHFINGLYEAQRNGAPVLLIASQLASSNLGTDFPQEVDFLSLYQNCSVFCQQVERASDARRIFTQAAQAALNQRGVAVVILPVDISSAEVEDDVPTPVWHPNPTIQPNEQELEQVIALLNEGKKIGIYAGVGCREAHSELIELARILKAPIAHTSRAKDRVEYNNPYTVGMTGLFGNQAGVAMVKACDTLLLLGCGFAWPNFYPKHAKIIQIDIDATRLGLRYPVALGLVGDVKATLNALIPKLTPRSDDAFLNDSVEHFQKASEKLAEKAVMDADKPIHPQYLFALVDRYAAPDTLFTADVGSAMVWACRYLNMNGSRRMLTSLKHASMANAMPQALGLQKAFPERQVVALSGDGGLTMLLGDLFTAVQAQLPIKIFVLNNGSLNFVEQEQKQEGLVERYTDLRNGDLAQVAQAIGFYARNVTRSEELEAAVQACLQHDGPALLNVTTSPFEIIMPPVVTADNVENMIKYGAKAIMSGRGKDVLALIKENL